MSFGALSEEAKTALARGAEMAGTGICSGEGGMLPEEQAENSRYFYELASARFGWRPELVEKVQAFHFKGGQGAKTGTGGHLPGDKVQGKIAEVRGLEPGQAAISPATFADLHTPADFKRIADEVRERSGGIPIGFKLSANHIEDDIDFALEASADYIILDGRGGGTGAAPLIFRDHISVPTIPALARARAHLDTRTGREVTLVITGGLRVAEDFAKAMALGADAIAVSNSAMNEGGAGLNAHLDAAVSIAAGSNDVRRHIVIPAIGLNTIQDSDAGFTLANIAARFTVDGMNGQDWIASPFVLVMSEALNQYADNIGRGQATALAYRSVHQQRHTLGYGVDYDRDLTPQTQAQLRGTVLHHFGDTENTIVARFSAAGAGGSDPFVTIGRDIQTQYVLEGGLSHQFRPRLTASVHAPEIGAATYPPGTARSSVQTQRSLKVLLKAVGAKIVACAQKLAINRSACQASLPKVFIKGRLILPMEVPMEMNCAMPSCPSTPNRSSK